PRRRTDRPRQRGRQGRRHAGANLAPQRGVDLGDGLLGEIDGGVADDAEQDADHLAQGFNLACACSSVVGRPPERSGPVRTPFIPTAFHRSASLRDVLLRKVMMKLTVACTLTSLMLLCTPVLACETQIDPLPCEPAAGLRQTEGQFIFAPRFRPV